MNRSIAALALITGVVVWLAPAAFADTATGHSSDQAAALAPPGAPTAVVASAGDQSIAINWTAPSTGDGVLWYTVAVAPPASQPGIGTCASTTSTSCNIYGGITNGVAYVATVTAHNAVGDGPGASSNAVTPTAHVTTTTVPAQLVTTTTVPAQLVTATTVPRPVVTASSPAVVVVSSTSRSVPATVRCAKTAAACSGTVSLATTARLVEPNRKVKVIPLPLGKVHYSLKAGSSQVVRLSLSANDVLLAQLRGRLVATETITVRGGAPVTKKVTLVGGAA